MSRTYRKVSESDQYLVRRWFEAREQLGNQKVFAARIGVSVERVQAIVAKIRAQRGRHEATKK